MSNEQKTQCKRHPNVWKYPWEKCEWCEEWEQEKKNKDEIKDDLPAPETWNPFEIDDFGDLITRWGAMFFYRSVVDIVICRAGRELPQSEISKMIDFQDYMTKNTKGLTPVTKWTDEMYSFLLSMILEELKLVKSRDYLEYLLRHIHENTHKII